MPTWPLDPPGVCLCKAHCQGVWKITRVGRGGALMKFFLDCNNDSHRWASFEGLKESMVSLSVKAFVGLKDRHSSQWVGRRYVVKVVLRCNHHPWKRGWKRQSDAFLPYRGDERRRGINGDYRRRNTRSSTHTLHFDDDFAVQSLDRDRTPHDGSYQREKRAVVFFCF